MTDLRAAASLLLLGLLSGCARVVAPAGGPEDKTPPALVSSWPESGAVNVPREPVVELRYTEWIDPSTLKGAVSVMPAPSRSPVVEVDGPVVRIRLREPLDSASTVILRLGSGIADFHKAGGKEPREIPFSTGPALDSGRLAVRVWTGSDTAAPSTFRGKVGIYALDTIRRSGLARLLRRRDSASWLSGPPSPWREKAWRWAVADSTGSLRMDHLPPGRWRVVAWADEDKDGYWRPGQEKLAWAGDLEWNGAAGSSSFLARLAPLDTVAVAPDTSAAVPDSATAARLRSRRQRDSLRALAPEETARRRVADSLARRSDSIARRDSTRLDSLALTESVLPDDSARILFLDSLPASFRGAAKLSCRLFRLDQRRRPVVPKQGAKGLEARVPRGGRWGGEVWIDLDGDGRVQSGDPVRGLPPEPWLPLKVATDDPAREELPLPLVPESLPSSGVPQ